ncbi:MAG TPA: metallophosphoesterase family protein [Candidatus Ozemobacteraceae bacterium]
MRVLLVSDIHSNLEALQAVIEAAPAERFDEVWCAGDITGYGPNPTECVEFFRTLPHARIVLGNHDAVIARLVPPLAFNPHAIAAVKKNLQAISPESAAWLAGLPKSLDLGRGMSLVHGSPLDPDEYLLSLELAIPSLSSMSGSGMKIAFFGHTHLPALYMHDRERDRYTEDPVIADHDIRIDIQENRTWLVNPGSVGQPRDGDPRAAFMELDIGENTIVIRSRRVYYKIASCQEKMRLQEYPVMLINRLNLGY